MSKTESRSATQRLFPTRTQSLRFPPLQHSNNNQPPASIPPSRLTLTSIPESRLTLSRLTLSRLTSVSKRTGSTLRRSETVGGNKNSDERFIFQSLSKKDHDKLRPIANAYSLPVPKIKVLILNTRSSDQQQQQQQKQQQNYSNDFDPPTRENTIVNDLKVVGSRIEPLKSAKTRSLPNRPDSAFRSNNSQSDYNQVDYQARVRNDNHRNSLAIDE